MLSWALSAYPRSAYEFINLLRQRHRGVSCDLEGGVWRGAFHGSSQNGGREPGEPRLRSSEGLLAIPQEEIRERGKLSRRWTRGASPSIFGPLTVRHLPETMRSTTCMTTPWMRAAGVVFLDLLITPAGSPPYLAHSF